MYTPPTDFVPLITGDGSITLRSEALNEQYHSTHGAVQESRHVFIHTGLHAVQRDHIDVLEVGLGTGLNALLTWVDAEERNIPVHYTAIEPYPIGPERSAAIDHPRAIAHPERTEAFLRMLATEPGEWHRVSDRFSFRWFMHPLQAFQADQPFDLVYYDAFSPRVQPELWTEAVFHQLHDLLRPGGSLVTYCAKGEVRRAMLAAGFTVTRRKGPPGKAQMLRALKAEPA